MRRLTPLALAGVLLSCLACRASAPVPPAARTACDTAAAVSPPDFVVRNMRDEARTLGLPPLDSVALPDGSREVRLWYGRSFDPVRRLLRIRADGDAVDGALILSWPIGPDGRVAYGNPVVLPGRCRHASERRPGHATCTTDTKGVVAWAELLHRVEAADVWALPDASQVPRENEVVDGHGVRVEVRDGRCYRSYAYGNPESETRREYRAAAALIRAVLETEAAWATAGR